jgi:uncharacterized protein (TIGR03083 family)
MLPRDEVVHGFPVEIRGFADLVRPLEARDWARQSRCEGWTVGDVAAHLIGALADITAGRIEGQGTPEVSDRQVAERRGRSPEELAGELDAVGRSMAALIAGIDDADWAGPTPGGYDMTLGQAMESLWCGTYVHADDIRAALGRAAERGPGLRASVQHVADLLTNRGWGPATLALDGMEKVQVGDVDAEETSREIRGDPLTFLLVATGRADPASFDLDPSVNVFG